jgi:hypothetical protein
VILAVFLIAVFTIMKEENLSKPSKTNDVIRGWILISGTMILSLVPILNWIIFIALMYLLWMFYDEGDGFRVYVISLSQPKE